MARTNAISILSGVSAPATLTEIYGLVIENVQKNAVSVGLKSQQFTGDPTTGSVEFKRFHNSTPQSYGTARTAGKGSKITAPAVTVNLSEHKEIVEEASKFDIDTFGVAGIMRRRADNHVASMTASLDREFFSKAVSEGTEFTPPSGDPPITAKVEAIIQAIEEIKNDYVDGVDRGMMNLILSPAQYGELRTYLDEQPKSNVDTASENFGLYHGIKVYSSTRLPNGIAGIIMIDGAIAQPAVINQYSEPEKIPLSNDYAVSLFYDYGTKTLTPDLVLYWSADAGSLGTLSVTSTAGESGKTIISVVETVRNGRKLVYSTHASTAPSVTYNADLSSWTDLPAGGVITATTGHKITVAEVTTDGKAKRSGSATVTSGT